MPSLQKWRELRREFADTVARVEALEAAQGALEPQVVALAEARQNGRPEAVRWLEEALSGGPQPAVALEERAAAAGIKPWELRLARLSLGVESRRLGFQGPFQWSLPP